MDSLLRTYPVVLLILYISRLIFIGNPSISDALVVISLAALCGLSQFFFKKSEIKALEEKIQEKDKILEDKLQKVNIQLLEIQEIKKSMATQKLATQNSMNLARF